MKCKTAKKQKQTKIGIVQQSNRKILEIEAKSIYLFPTEIAILNFNQF